MSTNAAYSTDAPPQTSVPEGDEFSPEEIAILKGETPPETVPPSPVANDTAPVDGEAGTDDELGDLDADDGAPDDQSRDEKGRFIKSVPRSAYLRVKGEKDATNQKLAQVAAELIRQREREAMWREAISASQQQPEGQSEREVSAEEDIFAFTKRQAQEIADLKKMIAGGDPWGLTERINNMQLQAETNNDIATFRAKEPAFIDAFAFLTKQREQELEAVGISDSAQRTKMITDEAREIFRNAFANKRSAAETIWKLAHARGFTAKPKEAPAINPKAAEQIERINKGKEASATLRGTGTTADTGTPLTLAKLADMSETEYLRTREAYVAKNGRAAWDRLTSGAG